jgi:trimeric autotransporter adhesin
MVGGAGDDAYFVDNFADAAFENTGEGNDAVYSTAHFRLSEHIESLILQGGADLQGYGNNLANLIYGNSGNNLLNGAGGADLMVGGVGNDSYFGDDPNDRCFEMSGEGNDIVFASCDYGLAANVETLVLLGSGNLEGVGSTGSQALYGNSGDNRLDGSVGADAMFGGAGNDNYIVDSGGDLVLENANDGTDSVLARVSYTLTTNVEQLVLWTQPGGSVSGTGNALNNIITASNLDDGGTRHYTLDGGAGADLLVTATSELDTIVFRAGEAGGDTILNFNNGYPGDTLRFVGFGTAAQGATLTRIGTTDDFQIHSGLDGHSEIISFPGLGFFMVPGTYDFI